MPVLRRGLSSFTLVEMLVVIAIIAILAALSLMAAQTLWQTASRKRAASEIQAMSTALESYKTDNGIYPTASGLTTNYTIDMSSGGTYQTASQSLYQALTGQTNYLDNPNTNAKSYMQFKINQLGNNTAPAGSSGANSTYIHDPWNNSYGYSTGVTNNYPFNGNGFFDLWSTAGQNSASTANTNAWVNNWTQ